MENNRYAAVRNGTIIVPPGPLPYWWTDPDTGNPHQMLALTTEELAALGWQKVIVENERNIYEDILVEVTSEIVLINNRVVERKRYSITLSAVQNMTAHLDKIANTKISRSTLENKLFIEATMVLAKPNNLQLSTDDFPFLTARISFDGPDLRSVATLVTALETAWTIQASQIERTRLINNQLIIQAATPEEALVIFESAL